MLKIGQIAMPPIKGSVRFEDVSFRFSGNGPYQVDDVSIEIPEGSCLLWSKRKRQSTLMKPF